MISTFDLLVLVATAQFKKAAADFSPNRILSFHLSNEKWLMVASQQEHNYRSEYAYDTLVCPVYKYRKVNEQPFCNLPAPHTAQGVTALYGAEEDIAGEKMYQSAVIIISAYQPNSFAKTVREADCNIKDSQGNNTFIIFTRVAPETVRYQFDDYLQGHKGLVSVTMKNGKRSYRTAVLARRRYSLSIVNKLISWYNDIYFSQVPELQLPVAMPECIP